RFPYTTLFRSSLTGEGIPDFLHATADLVDLAQRQTPDRPGYVLHRPVEVPFTVRQQDGIWLVEGVAARRAVAFADLTNPEAADMAATRLRRMGVDAALAAAGAEAGDEVQIGDLSFEYLPEPGEEE